MWVSGQVQTEAICEQQSTVLWGTGTLVLSCLSALESQLVNIIWILAQLKKGLRLCYRGNWSRSGWPDVTLNLSDCELSSQDEAFYHYEKEHM